MIGFGSIGRGTLPLILRHFECRPQPHGGHRPRRPRPPRSARAEQIRFVQEPVTRENYRELLTPLLTEGGGQRLLRQPLGRHVVARHHAALPRDRRALHRHRRRAVAGLLLRQERRAGGAHQQCAARQRCARRRRSNPGGTTAVSCCGANPGMVSWFVKQALIDLAEDLGHRGGGAGDRRSRRLGAAHARPRRQGHPHRRARHAARRRTRSR